MKTLTVIFSFLLLLLLTLSATAAPPPPNGTVTNSLPFYNAIGGNISIYRSGDGIFNSKNSNSHVSASKPVTTKAFMPLVDDLNNDSIQDIVILDGTSIKVFDTDLLNLVGSSIVSLTTASPLYIFDIDGDGFDEIMVADLSSSNEKIFVYNFSISAGLQLQNTILYNSVTHAGSGEVSMACRSPNNCLFIYGHNDDDTVSQGFIRASFMNSTNVSNQATILTGSAAPTSAFCLSKYNSIQIDDFDDDGDKDYVFSAVEIDATVSGRMVNYRIATVNINSSNNPSVGTSISISTAANVNLDNSDSCSGGNYGRHFTNALSADTSANNGHELILGFNLDSKSFEMMSFDKNGNLIDTHPDFFSADGVLVSDIMLGDIFEGGTGNDYCAVGYLSTTTLGLPIGCETGCIDMLCSSDNSNTDDKEFRYFTNNQFNVTFDYGNLNTLAHLSQQSHDGATGLDDDPFEMMNSYGVFRVSATTQNGSFFVGTLDRIFNPQHIQGTALTFDIENNGKSDMLYLTSTNLFYIDDGFSNSPAQFSEQVINPCIDSVWKQNTTIQVSLTITDPDDDLVNSTATLYSGELNSQKQSYGFFSSGTVFLYNFVANRIGSYLLEYTASDSGNEQKTIITRPFTVASVGKSFGECETIISGAEEIAANKTSSESLTPSADNIVKKGIAEINSFLGIGLIAVWILIMIGFNIFMVVKSHDYFKNMASVYLFGIIGFVDFSWIVLGAIVGIISFWVILLFMIIGIATSVIFISRQFAGG